MKLEPHFRVAFLILAVLAGGVVSGAAQEMGPTIAEPGVFTYQAPKGWTAKSMAVSRYPLAFDMPVNNFAANINVVVESTAKPLADYVAMNKAMLLSSPMFVSLQVMSDDPFVTTAGTKGDRVVVKDAMGKMNLQQTFYFFQGSGNNKFVVTATCKVGDGDHYAPFFDLSMKTFTPE
jgi:hypothetical protein